MQLELLVLVSVGATAMIVTTVPKSSSIEFLQLAAFGKRPLISFYGTRSSVRLHGDGLVTKLHPVDRCMNRTIAWSS